MSGVVDRCLWRGRSGEAGGAGTELAGVFIVAALLLSSLVAAAPGLGQQVVCGIGSSIAAVVDGSWSCEAPGGEDSEDRKPKEPCKLSEHSQIVDGNFTVGLEVVDVTISGDGGFIVEELSDGTYRVTERASLGASVGAGAGVGVELTVDNQKYGAYAGAGVEAGAASELGETYVVDSEEAKDALLDHLQRRAILGSGIGWIYNQFAGYEPPSPSEYYVSLNQQGSVGASATAVVGSVNAEVNESRALGMKVNPEEGTVTTYFKVKADGSAQATALRQGAEAEGSFEGVIAVTVDANDPEKLLNVTASAMVDGSATIDGLDGEPLAKGGQILTASLDITSAETLSIANDLLGSAGIGPHGPAIGAVRATNTIFKAAAERGTLTRQNVNRDSHYTGAQVDLPFIAAGGGYLDERVEFSGGEYYDGRQWKPWDGC